MNNLDLARVLDGIEPSQPIAPPRDDPGRHP